MLFTNVSWCGINSYEIHCALINKSETIEKGNCIYSSVEVKLIFDCYSVVYSLATEPESSTKMLLFKIFYKNLKSLKFIFIIDIPLIESHSFILIDKQLTRLTYVHLTEDI